MPAGDSMLNLLKEMEADAEIQTWAPATIACRHWPWRIESTARWRASREDEQAVSTVREGPRKSYAKLT